MKDIVVSKAQLARELDCSRSSITELCAKGLPCRADGRLNRAECLRWIVHRTSGANGGWSVQVRGKADLRERAGALLRGETARSKSQKPTSPVPAPELPAAGFDWNDPAVRALGQISFDQGRAKLAHHLCGNMRTVLAEFFGGLKYEALSPEESLDRRVFPLAAMVYLMDAWLEDQLAEAKKIGLKPLPAIAWRRHFGAEAKSARELFEGLQEYWASGEDAAT